VVVPISSIKLLIFSVDRERSQVLSLIERLNLSPIDVKHGFGVGGDIDEDRVLVNKALLGLLIKGSDKQKVITGS